LSYRKSSKSQYARKKPYGWPLGYFSRGKYQVAKDYHIPKSAESVDLVVPMQQDLQLPVDVQVIQRSRPIGKDERLIVRVPRERLRDFDVEGAPVEPELTEPQPKPVRKVTEYDQQIGAIRKALKKLCPTLSVRRGSGTAYGWIDVWGSGDEFRNFTDEEKQALEKFGLGYGGNCAVIAPESREYYVKKASELLS